jgi:hypothetical protein
MRPRFRHPPTRSLPAFLAAAPTHMRETQMKIIVALFIGATLGLFAAAICTATD